MIKGETVTFTYKASSGIAPGYLSNLFQDTSAPEIDMNLRNATALFQGLTLPVGRKLCISGVQRLRPRSHENGTFLPADFENGRF